VIGQYVMLDADGSIGDLITLGNFGPGGSAAITFQSDPFPVPEPATIGLLGLGLVAGYRRVTRKARSLV
jgi:hypothetical protein